MPVRFDIVVHMANFLPTPPKTPNTLRLHGAPLQRLLDALDAAMDQSAGGAAKRDHRRWGMRAVPDVQIDIQQPGGTVTNLRYVCRDLSGSGVGVLHSAFIYPGTRCVVHLPVTGNRTTAVPAAVVRCRLLDKGIHEIGIKFRQSVTVREFVDLNPFEGKFSLESIDPNALKGSLLHIEDSAMDRKLVRHLLQDTQLGVVTAETAAEGRKRAGENLDLIICDVQMPGMTGIELCRAIRDDGVQTPIVMVSAEQGQSIPEDAKSAGANAFLRKPFTRELLLAAAAEFLILAPVSTDGCGPIFSSVPADNPLAKFVPEFIEELRATAKRLTLAIDKDDVEAVRQECFQVMGAAASLGFEPVGRAASAALQQVTASMSVQESSKAVKDLVFACRRVRGREAA